MIFWTGPDLRREGERPRIPGLPPAKPGSAIHTVYRRAVYVLSFTNKLRKTPTYTAIQFVKRTQTYSVWYHSENNNNNNNINTPIYKEQQCG